MSARAPFSCERLAAAANLMERRPALQLREALEIVDALLPHGGATSPMTKPVPPGGALPKPATAAEELAVSELQQHNGGLSFADGLAIVRALAGDKDARAAVERWQKSRPKEQRFVLPETKPSTSPRTPGAPIPMPPRPPTPAEAGKALELRLSFAYSESEALTVVRALAGDKDARAIVDTWKSTPRLTHRGGK